MKTAKMPPTDLDQIMPMLIGIWRRFCKLSGPADVLQTREFRQVVEAVLKLRENLETGERTGSQDDWNDPAFLGAHLLYDWVLHYQQGLALIHEMPSAPKRVLDLASGAGAFAFASMRQGASDVIVLNRNRSALTLAGQICGRYGFSLTARQHSPLFFPLPVEGTFDLVIVAHRLRELFPDTRKSWREAQRDWIERLSTYLSPSGTLLLVDSSVMHANHRFLALRDELVEAGWPVQAPCVWKGKCPALQANSLCYAQRDFEKPYVVKEIQRAAGINLGSLKMSYLMLKHRSAHWPQLPQGRPFYRVISPPIEARSGKRYHLCGTDGKKDIGSHFDEQPPEARAFDYLKRGELISVEEALNKQQHFDIVQGTRVKLEAALSKPLPSDPLT